MAYALSSPKPKKPVDAESPFHEKARIWCEKVLSGPEPLTLLPAVVFGFVRIATHPKVFSAPLSVGEAADLTEHR